MTQSDQTINIKEETKGQTDLELEDTTLSSK